MRVFPSQKCSPDSLSVCPTPVCMYTSTQKNDHARTLKILLSISEFGGLRKHDKAQHALVGLGGAALAAAVALKFATILMTFAVLTGS